MRTVIVTEQAGWQPLARAISAGPACLPSRRRSGYQRIARTIPSVALISIAPAAHAAAPRAGAAGPRTGL
jgi:hypothetical protein